MLVIQASLEAEIRRIEVPSQLGHSPRDSIFKILNIKRDWWSGSSCREPA
jgi:hypothetical protein